MFNRITVATTNDYRYGLLNCIWTFDILTLDLHHMLPTVVGSEFVFSVMRAGDTMSQRTMGLFWFKARHFSIEIFIIKIWSPDHLILMRETPHRIRRHLYIERQIAHRASVGTALALSDNKHITYNAAEMKCSNVIVIVVFLHLLTFMDVSATAPFFRILDSICWLGTTSR